MLASISHAKYMEWIAFFEMEEQDHKDAENGKGKKVTSLV